MTSSRAPLIPLGLFVLAMNSTNPHILTINGGSSSLKFALFNGIDPTERIVSGKVDRIGLENARWVVDQTGSFSAENSQVDAPNQQVAVHLLLEWLDRSNGFEAITAIGHRIVHGGSLYYRPERITPQMIEDLCKISYYDPEHLPGEIELIKAFRNRDPNLPQVACFDTAFHHDMPRVAQIIPIPRRFEAEGVRRYGFHGLSYAFLMEELARVAGPEEARGRIILAHLGNGASMAAVHEGRSIDTTMGFTPTAGLVMGTRTGDLDPGLVRFLSRHEGMTADQFDHLVNHESGLLGVSETSSDVRDLLARQGADIRSAEAIELFCYQVKKWIGAFAAAMGGIDTLVFSGGIGENALEIRSRVCAGLSFLGITLDEGRNAASALQISTGQGLVRVRVIRTDEELMIARSVSRVLNS